MLILYNFLLYRKISFSANHYILKFTFVQPLAINFSYYIVLCKYL